MKKTITIVDYGMGNLSSVANALEHLGRFSKISGTPEGVRTADVIILPGVGAFGGAMQNLKEQDLIDELTRQVIEKKKPFLGICLGMQLIGSSSEELGFNKGLGWIDAAVIKFDPSGGLRLPHIGWNTVDFKHDSLLFKGVTVDKNFYFVHSYHLNCNSDYVEAYSDYGLRFASAIRNKNVFATQFHPEKSHENGFKVLKNFLEFADQN